MGYLIVGLLYLAYLIIKTFNDFVARIFMKMPRLMKIAIIYLLIANVVLDVIDIIKVENNYKNVSVLATQIETYAEPQNLTSVEEKEQTCIFDTTSCLIAEKGEKIGLNEEQILISISIAKWETGNYTSDAFKNKNNVGGMMCNSGLINYSTLEDGINAFVSNLKYNYFDVGLTTLELIQPKYCPIGASNDPTNLNQYWLNGTTKIYNELRGN
jgi:hypothetical protein